VSQLQINETCWSESYPQIHAQARRLVHQLKVGHWQGQEEDVAWDIVQESMRKTLEYARKVESGGYEPIQSLTALLTTVVQNYGRDLRRREWRLQRETTHAFQGFVDNEQNFGDVAIENVHLEHLFRFLAHEIARFPRKQRQALLMDLADRMAFEEQPSTLQAAFQAEGIHLEEYRNSYPQGARERNRNAALLNHAYNRLKGLEEIKKYLT
jgi:DNA-directed RNA polymerase specialized sigma24 family protein